MDFLLTFGDRVTVVYSVRPISKSENRSVPDHRMLEGEVDEVKPESEKKANSDASVGVEPPNYFLNLSKIVTKPKAFSVRHGSKKENPTDSIGTTHGTLYPKAKEACSISSGVHPNKTRKNESGVRTANSYRVVVNCSKSEIKGDEEKKYSEIRYDPDASDLRG